MKDAPQAEFRNSPICLASPCIHSETGVEGMHISQINHDRPENAVNLTIADYFLSLLVELVHHLSSLPSVMNDQVDPKTK